MMQEIKSNPARTVLTISTGFLLLYLITKWEWPLYLATVVGVLGVVSTYASQKIEWVWIQIAWILSLIVPKIVLSLIFFCLLFPIALLSKLFRKSDLLLLKNTEESTFKDGQKEFDKSSFEKIW